MTWLLAEKMPEAETSLRLAIFLLSNGLANLVEVAIDGAQVRIAGVVHFAIGRFLSEAQFSRIESALEWRGTYRHEPTSGQIVLHSNPGRGDVVALLNDGRTLRVEAKKGPLVSSKSSAEYPLLREALGQVLTVQDAGPSDLFGVAVPHSPKFSDLAGRWRRAPLVARAGIMILTVTRDGQVHGFEP